jgi:dUTP pyrophosphatase
MIKVKRLTESAIIPTKAHETDAGFDLYSDKEDSIIPPKSRMGFGTGVSIVLPEIPYPNFNTYLRIAPRSGLSVKKGLDVFAGVIDLDYRGEIIVCLFNSSDEPVEIKKGDKIAQIIPTIILNDKLIEVQELDETERGTKGFGSSDKK